MTLNQAINEAKTKASKEALVNDYGDSMMFVVWDEEYCCYIVMNEWHYDLGQGIGDIDVAAATVWSDGQAIEIERLNR